MSLRIVLLCLLATLLAACQTSADFQVASEFPIYGNDGKPDLTVDAKRLAARMDVVDRYFSADECALKEGDVGTVGVRRLLQFDVAILNAGDGDLVVGDRSDPNNIYANLFEYAPCHQHFHINDFSLYELLRASDRSVVATSRKLGFCFRDNLDYMGGPSAHYLCTDQGISSGWADLYARETDGQWIDITGIPEGDYIVRVNINVSGSFDEGANRYPNTVEVPVHVPAPGQPLTGPLAHTP
ncbi:MAG: hypothetical protein H6R10_637 [Rhodocyclaceae bacterium]|nr:hypothetical protein [Rhodocyclaceae bacterium]